ncbi:MAG: P-loop domain-containing protein, partial [Acidobacteriota bacterium]
MRPIDSLKPQLRGLAGKDFAAYQSLKGGYTCDRFHLHIDQIPKDPYAPPGTGVLRVVVQREDTGVPESYLSSNTWRVALTDYLARRFYDACTRHCRGRRGTGNSGVITVAEPGQEILDRTSVHVNDDIVEVRFFLGLPASGRSVDADVAHDMLFDELPKIAVSALMAENLDLDRLERHAQASEDAECLRERLSELGLVAFVADGAVLPRSSGVDPRPLQAQTVVPFRSPDSLRVTVELPHAGTISGLGIPNGVTLIVGGGYHGKSTLLQALELGIYNHIPGDGRELCVALRSTVKVRATSGRSVASTDISAFINNLPLGQETSSFSTENASGSTSQAAFIAESIEVGARVLMMDEDTCAANFMIRDGRMQQLVSRDQEPITAFVDRVRQLYDQLGVSTI